MAASVYIPTNSAREFPFLHTLSSTVIWQNGTDEPIYKAEIEMEMQRTKIWMPRQEQGDGMDWEVGTDMYKLLCMKQVTSESPLYITGKSAHWSVVT